MEDAVRYSIQPFNGPTGPAILLQAHEPEWTPARDQVEISSAEAARHVDIDRLDRYWRRVEFEMTRMSFGYRQLEQLLKPAQRAAHGRRQHNRVRLNSNG